MGFNNCCQLNHCSIWFMLQNQLHILLCFYNKTCRNYAYFVEKCKLLWDQFNQISHMKILSSEFEK